MVEQWTENPRVTGSIPVLGTICASGSVVEHRLAKARVASSNLVSRFRESVLRISRPIFLYKAEKPCESFLEKENEKMENRLEQAKAALQGEITFAAVLQDGRLVTSERKGIAPMMALLSEDLNLLKGACVADRVIGRAAALLMEKAGIAEAFGEVVSSHALKAFEKSGISFAYGKEVEYIINRTKTGMCPMEQTVLDMEDAEAAYEALKLKLTELAKG